MWRIGERCGLSLAFLRALPPRIFAAGANPMKNARLLPTGRVTLALIALSLGLCAQAQTQPPARLGAQGSTEKVIHTFNPAPQGYYPLGTVVADQLGNLYGTARLGGT